MAAIDIGPGATDRASAWYTSTWTIICKENPADGTGAITSFEFWFDTAYGAAAGVKAGTFSGSGTSYTNRDYETIGVVAAGSKQTFSGLNCAVTVGDFIGTTQTGTPGAAFEAVTTGGDMYYKVGEQWGTGAQTYTAFAYIISVYGTGATGWANIAFVRGIASASIAQKKGVAVASISHVKGVAV